MAHPSQHGRKYSTLLLIACFIAAFSLTIFAAPRVYADNVTIDDQAKVLDVSKVQAEATKLPNAMFIYTTNTFSGDQKALDQATRSRLPDQNSIAMGIDAAQRHLSIQSGTSVQLSDSQASGAVDTFRSNFNNGDYTGATVAAIDSLINALSPGTSTNSNSGVTGSNNGTTYSNNDPTLQPTDTSSSDNGSAVPGIIIAVVLLIIFVLFIALVLRGARKKGDDDDTWRGPRGGGGDHFSRGVLYGSMLEESQHHHHQHAESPFGNGFGGNNFGGGFGGGAGGSFGGGNFGGGAGGSFGGSNSGGGSTGGGAGGSF